MSAGVGHERAARAVESALVALDPSCEPIVRDALEFSSPFLRTFYASAYNRLVDRVPRVWGFFYRRAEEIPASSFRQRVRSAILAAGCRDFANAARRFQADAVLCTQFLPAEVFALLRRRGSIQIPVYCAITDYSIHPIWVYPGIDRYFVATAAANEQLIETGVVAAERIEVTGVPIDPRFATGVGTEAARRALGLDPDPRRRTLLLMGGGFGWGPMEEMVDVVLRLPESAQALVIAGKNESLRQRLAERVKGHERRIQVHGFTDRVHLFLEAADLLVGKAGGLTSSEAMARGVPIVAFRPIPGQEERNVDYLQESGAAVRVHDLFDLKVKLTHFLSDRADLERMKANARAIGRPRSAFQVAESILSRLTPPGPGGSMP
ncbi:MAG TPA: glycosyltransferase [Candidatus Eisenbacteria bacterium]|nr:glycosyltransferase [Candidatus Eisenbacteria bacterium]